MLSFNVSEEDGALIDRIVDRAFSIKDIPSAKISGKLVGSGNDRLSVSMDLWATHASGCPLDLQKFLDADNFNFVHDLFGIINNIDRRTGELQNCFLPRCAKSDAGHAVPETCPHCGEGLPEDVGEICPDCLSNIYD